MEVTNTTGPAATQNSGLHRSPLCLYIELSCCLLCSILWSPYGIGRPYIFSCCGLLRSPYGIGQTIIFSCCGLFFLLLLMVVLCNRADHYIFMLWFVVLLLLLSFFSSPNLSSRRLDVYHTSAHGVVLV